MIEAGKDLYVSCIARANLCLENLATNNENPVIAPNSTTTPAASSVVTSKVNQVLSQLDEAEVEIIGSAEHSHAAQV